MTEPRHDPSAFRRAEARTARVLAAHGVTGLRCSLGLVFLLFGALKFVPGASPAAALAQRTVESLTLGLVTGQAAVLLTAVLETVVGLTLLTGVAVRWGLLVLAPVLVGILAPLVLFPGELFPDGRPTLVAQYVVKDVVLVAAAVVVAATTLGARLVVPADADRPDRVGRVGRVGRTVGGG